MQRWPIAVLLAGPCFAQGLASATAKLNQDGAVTVDASYSYRPALPATPPILAAPFSGEELSDELVLQPDGSKREHTRLLGWIFRDSQGRTRTERPLPLGPSIDTPPLLVEIIDPAAGSLFVLDSQNKLAHHYSFSAVAEMLKSEPKVATKEDPALPPEERLGTRKMAGVTVEGKRSTRTIRGADGSNRSLISEVWTSKELQLVVSTKLIDTAAGESTTQFRNLDRSEPDPALFQVPPGYKVREEESSFLLNFKTGQ